MSENNESGNRWEAVDQPAAEAAMAPLVESAEPAQLPDEGVLTDVAPIEGHRASKLPHWVNKRGLVASGTAAAFFLGGGGVGYAIGTNGHHDDSRPFPGRFDRSGLGPGQLPGDGQGAFPGPQDQNQSQDDGSSSSSLGTQS